MFKIAALAIAISLIAVVGAQALVAIRNQAQSDFGTARMQTTAEKLQSTKTDAEVALKRPLPEQTSLLQSECSGAGAGSVRARGGISLIEMV